MGFLDEMTQNIELRFRFSLNFSSSAWLRFHEFYLSTTSIHTNFPWKFSLKASSSVFINALQKLLLLFLELINKIVSHIYCHVLGGVHNINRFHWRRYVRQHFTFQMTLYNGSMYTPPRSIYLLWLYIPLYLHCVIW